MASGVPVIRCDVCGQVTPARFLPCKGHKGTTEEQRASDLRGEGWRLTPTRDTCPNCTPHEKDQPGG